jgi:hypothetical protein
VFDLFCWIKNTDSNMKIYTDIRQHFEVAEMETGTKVVLLPANKRGIEVFSRILPSPSVLKDH